jgi:NPCBM/NEW2 domain
MFVECPRTFVRGLRPELSMFVSLIALILAQPPAAPAYTTVSATETISGPWRPLDKFALANLVTIRREGPLPAWPRAAGAILVNGDRIPGELLLGDDTSVILKSSLNPQGLRVSLPALRVLWIAPPAANVSDFPDRYSWLDANRKTDVVLLRNGDTVAGDIEAFTNEGKLRIKSIAEGKSIVLDSGAMTAVAFNPSLGAIRKVKGPIARLVLTDGTRVSLANVAADGATLKGASLFGAALQIPVRDLLSLDVLQGKATFLADLKPKAETVEPFNDLAWPWQANRSVKHRPLRLATRLGASTFDAGLGTHPKTTLTYALDGKYRAFTAIVGLDAETGRRGQAKVSILVDGQRRTIDGLETLSAATGPVAIDVSVAKAKELTLVVDFGPNGDVQADVNWADARLIE